MFAGSLFLYRLPRKNKQNIPMVIKLRLYRCQNRSQKADGGPQMLSLGSVKESPKEEKLKSGSCRDSATLTACMDLSMHVQNKLIVYRKPTPSSRFSTASVSASDTHSSMALFHMMTYPDKTKDSMLTMCVFPRSVPTYSHLL